MDLKLTGKRVLITGASKGIGSAIAQSFAAEGSNLVLVSRDQAALEARRESIRAKYNVDVDVEVSDLTKQGSAAALATKYADVDVLVNNAGAIPQGTLEAVDEAAWRNAWELKVFGFINLSREYFARMRERRSGVILNIIGLAGDRPNFHYIVGSAGNASLMAFTRALGGESADYNVRVVGINPGATETERLVKAMRAQAGRKLGDPERWQELTQRLPFGRAARPDEVADVAVFLASERAGYVSGVVLNVDGGVSSRAG